MKDLPTWSDLNKGVRNMTDKEFEYCEEMEKRKHDDKLKELRNVQLLSQHILDLQKDKGKLTDRVRELEAQIEKMKSVLIDIKSNTDDVNIEWQIKYLFDELEIKEK